jgi:hypothetical protein
MDATIQQFITPGEEFAFFPACSLAALLPTPLPPPYPVLCQRCFFLRAQRCDGGGGRRWRNRECYLLLCSLTSQGVLVGICLLAYHQQTGTYAYGSHQKYPATYVGPIYLIIHLWHAPPARTNCIFHSSFPQISVDLQNDVTMSGNYAANKG